MERAAAASRAGQYLDAIAAYQALEAQFPEAAQRARSGERIAEARRALQEAYQLKQNLEVAQQMLRHAQRSKGDGLKMLAKTWATEASTLFSKEEAGCCDKVKLVLKQASYFVAHLESPAAAQSSNGGQAAKEAGQLFVTVNAANVRSGAGTQHGIVAQLQRGDPVSTLEEEGSWVRVRLPDDSQGWIYRSLLSERAPN
ncbi:MAG: SH3 domain-containing protein [Candidatus Tectomicrobia bacterium]|nr:SH3 domain-containing protein [Candidatus Tectomicrobia bacterium]